MHIFEPLIPNEKSAPILFGKAVNQTVAMPKAPLLQVSCHPKIDRAVSFVGHDVNITRLIHLLLSCCVPQRRLGSRTNTGDVPFEAGPRHAPGNTNLCVPAKAGIQRVHETLKLQPFSTSTNVLPRSDGDADMRMPAASIAAILLSASPLPPETIAPA
jgi:hypothetical protein